MREMHRTMMSAATSRLLPAARSRVHDSAAAVAASRRLALAVFVVVLAPAARHVAELSVSEEMSTTAGQPHAVV